MPRCFCQIYTHNNLTLSRHDARLDGSGLSRYNKSEKSEALCQHTV